MSRFEVRPEWLEALEAARGVPPTASAIERSSVAFGHEAARWAFTQWELRERARAKFEHPETMLFVREASEQASSAALAQYHASLFPPGELVVDATAGIGGDLIELAKRGPTIGFELDPERATYAAWNVRAAGQSALVVLGDGRDGLACAEFALLDPSRRVQGRRTLAPDLMTPNPFELAPTLRRMQLAAVKLSPMLSDKTLSSFASEIRFVGVRWDCSEASALLGQSAGSGRSAVLLAEDLVLEGEDSRPPASEEGDWVYEAHPAAIRAGALSSLARRHSLTALGDAPGYLIGAQASSPALRGYRILGRSPVDRKKLRAQARLLGVAPTVCKIRGDKTSPRTLLENFAGLTGRPCQLIVYRLGRSLRALFVEGPAQSWPESAENEMGTSRGL